MYALRLGVEDSRLVLAHAGSRRAMAVPQEFPREILRIQRRNGPPLELLLHGRVRGHAVRSRIEELVAGQAASVARGVSALSRGERSVSAWREQIARLANRETGFRDAAIGAADLERVLQDASAPVDHRVGAALALRVAYPEVARVRIHVAADGAANEELRAALLATAEVDVDEETIERATARPLRASNQMSK